jgi:hypothetical protein
MVTLRRFVPGRWFGLGLLGGFWAGVCVGWAETAKEDGGGEPAGPAEASGWLRFRLQELHQDRNEGMAVEDFNGDGHPNPLAPDLRSAQ